MPTTQFRQEEAVKRFKPLEFRQVFEVVLFSPGATFFRRQVHSVHSSQASAQGAVEILRGGWKVNPRWAIKASDGRYYFVNATPIGFQDVTPPTAMDPTLALDADADEPSPQGTGNGAPGDPESEREAEERSYREAWNTVVRNPAEE